MPSVMPDGDEGRPSTRAKPLQARRPEADELCALLAHDLKTPLAAIGMNLDFALIELERDPAAVRAALDDCRAANARAVRLVTDMADAIRLSNGERVATLTEIGLSQVIESAVSRVAREAETRGVRILWASANDVVRCDAQLLERAVERLVERAMRQTVAGCVIVDQRGGAVTIRTEVTTSLRPASACLATAFALAVALAHGARFTQQEHDGLLVYRLKLAAP